ncbi:hypothetical protein ACFE04_031629 [Oxalis oulophora]
MADQVYDYELAVGKEYPDASTCRRILKEAAIHHRFEMKILKSDKIRFTAKCANEGCPWRIYASKLPEVSTFVVKTLHAEHTCNGATHPGHIQASSKWVANKMQQLLRNNPNLTSKDIVGEIKRVHGVEVSYKKAWRGKETVLTHLKNIFVEDYRMLPQYCHLIKQTNPGSIAFVNGDEVDGSFQKLFVSYRASIAGFFTGCRPILVIDKVPLTNDYPGTLLFAASFDGDEGLFPLAFGIVNEKIGKDWTWFVSELSNLIKTNSENIPKIMIYSDGENGILEDLKVNFPFDFNGLSMHHLAGSFQREFDDPRLLDLLWETANSLTPTEFDKRINQIEEISKDAADWIRKFDPHLWAPVYVEESRFAQLTAGMVESLNSWKREITPYPVIYLMETIRRELTIWFEERFKTSMQWVGDLVPSAEKNLSEALELANANKLLDGDGKKHEIDINKRTCTCRKWQERGMPCAHAVAALGKCNQELDLYIDKYFTLENYQKTYSEAIHPVPDRVDWKGMLDEGLDEVIINPPKVTPSGAHSKKRQARPSENSREKRSVHCSRCNEAGHYRKTCSANI